MRRIGISEGDGAPTRVGRVPEQNGDQTELERRKDKYPGSLRVSLGLISEVARKVNETIDLVDIDKVEDRMISLRRGTQWASKERIILKIAVLKKQLKVSEDYIARERKRLTVLPELGNVDLMRLKGLQAENVNAEAHRRVIKELERALEEEK